MHTAPAPFRTEFGADLGAVDIAYHTFGTRAADDSNVVWICHALTGDSDPTAWWPGLVGAGKVIDPAKHFIICANMLGSCYGSTGPASIDRSTGTPWLHRFPLITIRDMVHAHRSLARHLGIRRIALLVGGSMGGQQALEWAVDPELPIDRLFLTATNAVHSPYAIAFNSAQRMAIEADASYHSNDVDGGSAGMQAARAVAMLSYRSRQDYDERRNDTVPDPLQPSASERYQRHQGLKLAQRFNAHSYVTLSRAMDSHDLGRGRGGIGPALARIQARTSVVAIESDLLFPPREQRIIADHVKGASYAEIPSTYGHDGFLIETEALAHILNHTLLQ